MPSDVTASRTSSAIFSTDGDETNSTASDSASGRRAGCFVNRARRTVASSLGAILSRTSAARALGLERCPPVAGAGFLGLSVAITAPVVTRNPIRIGWRVLTSPLPAINWEEREIVGCRWRGSCA
jgi:hypothetical protein